MVEWKKLGEVCKIVSPPKKLGKELYSDVGLYPIIDQGQKEIVGFTDDLTALLPYGEYVLFGDHTRFVKYHEGKFAQGADGLKILKANELILPRYLFYAFDNTEVPSRGYSRHWAIAKDIPIPIPSLSEQQRIVSILDTFTSSISNLKQQIEERRKQYEYERDLLLDLEGKEGVEMKKLGEVGEFIRGNGIQKNDFIEEGYGCIHYGQIHARYGFSAKETISKIEESLYKKCKKAKTGDVILATTSEDAEGVAKPFVWLGENDVAVSGDAFIYHHNQIGKFMGYQFLTRKFMQFKVKYATGAKVVRISGENMAKFEIALPSLSEQSRIVSILDTFEQSIANLEEQLAMREKQYEYYREKLLRFEKA